jgi:hypothetical protein
MKIKAYISMAIVTVLVGTAVGAYATSTNASARDVEDTLKHTLFSAEYENYLPTDWFKSEKMKAQLSRKDAAYLAIYTLSKASGNAADWISYTTELRDTQDPMLRRAIDLGLMSADQNMNFNGAKPVTQQEFAVMTTKLALKLNVYNKPTVAMTYKDQKDIDTWAKESVQYVSQMKWALWVKDGKFEPKKPITLGRAVSVMDQFLVNVKVYPTSKIASSEAKLIEVKGYKVPLPTQTEIEISVTPEGRLKMTYNGVLKNRAANNHKGVVEQLITIIDSNPAVSYDARSALVTTLDKAWDETTQQYKFEKDHYIELENGKVSATKPNGDAILVKKGTVLHLEIIH